MNVYFDWTNERTDEQPSKYNTFWRGEREREKDAFGWCCCTKITRFAWFLHSTWAADDLCRASSSIPSTLDSFLLFFAVVVVVVVLPINVILNSTQLHNLYLVDPATLYNNSFVIIIVIMRSVLWPPQCRQLIDWILFSFCEWVKEWVYSWGAVYMCTVLWFLSHLAPYISGCSGAVVVQLGTIFKGKKFILLFNGFWRIIKLWWDWFEKNLIYWTNNRWFSNGIWICTDSNNRKDIRKPEKTDCLPPSERLKRCSQLKGRFR